MRLRGSPPALIIDAAVTVAMRGHAVPWTKIEAIYLARGNAEMDQ
jgi:hypothetical protein